MSFAAAHPSLVQTLTARGYAEPTPVQAAVLAPETADRDLLVSARTGSGKTVAFGLTLATVLLGDATSFGRPGTPLALVVAPTRELALQVREELAWLFASTGARVVSCVGGMDVRREQRMLFEGAHIVVGTPGRLCDHLSRGALRLDAVRAVVLDEADEMLDLGFREELEKLLDATPATRRTLMFSATLPQGILGLASRYQKDALRIAATAAGEQHVDIEQRVVVIAPREREHAIVNILRLLDPPTSLVFCATRDGVAHLFANLLERGFSAVALSGELSQNERARALQSLRDGRARVLVATDVAARGLDLPELALVIHADLPHDAQVLLHRSGRTGRAGKKGVSVLLVPAPRRRIAERLLRDARVSARWSAPPMGDDVRAKDQERIAAELASKITEPAEDELATAKALAAAHSAEALAAALIRQYRVGWPEPEELPETEAMQARFAPASERAPRPEGPGYERPVRAEGGVSERPVRAEGSVAERPVRAEPPVRQEGASERPTRPVREAAPAAEEAPRPAGMPRPPGDEPARPKRLVDGGTRTPRRTVAPGTEGGLRPAYRARPTPEAPSQNVWSEDEGRTGDAEAAPDRRSSRNAGDRGEVRGVWFRMNIGRAQNADPRWLIPLICRRGDVQKDDIGAIRIHDEETRFEIAEDAARRFEAAVRRPDRKDPRVRFELLRWG
jgi:ATP-dependent RNA helicase DeaD